jgi:cytochrome c oxidase cbb3-type subunit III
LAASGSPFLVQSAAQKAARSNAANSPGKQLFSANCASCHGLDARGGERAPNIAQRAEIQRLSDEALMRIVQNGISGAGMPAFHSFSISEVKAVVAYLRILQGANQGATQAGDSERGKELFFGKAGCSACHAVAGSGGFIASDLSGFAHSHSPAEIRSAVTNPSQDLERPSVVVTAVDGQTYAGRIRNEDNFSLQLQTLDGAFHFLARSDVAKVEADSRSEMPTDYGTTLSSKDLDDLISYLIASAKTGESTSGKGNEERE